MHWGFLYKFLLALTLSAHCLTPAMNGQDRVSRDNYTGDWESPSSWDPVWENPETSYSGFKVTINGYITVNGPLELFGSPTEIIVNDTLVVKGDLILGNNSNLKINNNAIVIIWGNMYFHNNTEMEENGYLIVAGDLIKEGSLNHGSFTSNDDPVRLYVGGTVSEDVDGHPNYPVLNCSDPSTEPHSNSGCSYGNMDDLMNDPVFDFFQSTCPLPVVVVTNPPPLCEPETADLTDPAITEGSDPDLTWSFHTDPEATEEMETPHEAGAGTYYIKGTTIHGCYSIEPVTVTVNPLPEVTITSSDSPLCIGDRRELAGVPAGGTFSVKSGPGHISGNVLSANSTGYIDIEYLYSDGCENSAIQSIWAEDYPVPDPGPDQELDFIFNTRMQASLMPFETGEWSLVSGSGQIGNSGSPVTEINNLSLGENSFLWTVNNRACIAEAEVRIIVNDLFVPSVITPNEDGKNDYFLIREVEGPVELIIFNRWGMEEYRNTNYLNTWDGRNKNGVMLPDDTYFYILRFDNGQTRQGTVLIIR